MARVWILGLVLLAACKKTPPEVAATEAATPAPVEVKATLDEKRLEAIIQMHANFSRVMFELDSSELGPESLQALQENARIMSEFPRLKVEIQGHADERGTTEYNLGLGDRRATSVQKAMTTMGVAPSRFSVVSFGEERPVDAASNEVAWSKNRRVEFRVMVAQEGVAGTIE